MKSTQGLIHDVTNTSGTRAGLDHDVTDTDCQVHNGRVHGCVYATFKHGLSTKWTTKID